MAPRVRHGFAALLLASLATACSSSPTGPDVTRSASSGLNPASDETPVVIFVISQRLFFDACVVKEPLPMHGEFQLLSDGRTEFGPGQPGFLDGRWWEDVNGNSIQDQSDHFFFCPLLLPGRLVR
jgi:hypothetical protein